MDATTGISPKKFKAALTVFFATRPTPKDTIFEKLTNLIQNDNEQN